MFQQTQWTNASNGGICCNAPSGNFHWSLLLEVPSGGFWEVSTGNCIPKASIECRPWHAMDAPGALAHGACFGAGSVICEAQLLLSLR
jgi:hypothetical protein